MDECDLGAAAFLVDLAASLDEAQMPIGINHLPFAVDRQIGERDFRLLRRGRAKACSPRGLLSGCGGS